VKDRQNTMSRRKFGETFEPRSFARAPEVLWITTEEPFARRVVAGSVVTELLRGPPSAVSDRCKQASATLPRDVGEILI
jgi:hypothetical protein